MKAPLIVNLASKTTGRKVNATIQLAREQDIFLWANWRYRPEDEDRDWDWWKIFGDYRNEPLRYECYSAIAAEELQGLMLLDLDPKPIGVGRAITIDYLASGPQNRPPAG